MTTKKAASKSTPASTKNNKPAEKAGTPAPAPAGMVLKTAHLAKKYNMRPQALRRILRSMDEYNDFKFTRYAWQVGDKKSEEALKRIDERIKGIEKETAEKVAAAKAAAATA